MRCGMPRSPRSREIVAAALAEGGRKRPSRFTWPDGRTPNLRRIVSDVTEESALPHGHMGHMGHMGHTGHADLLREVVDGLVGEDEPRL